ncbi:MAG: Stp1/IreP family PP2C-type Ser/Thr phosphatase [Patescibacteria group bacterium]
MRFGVCTDSGRQRPNNQDAYGHRNGLFLVADGMGGYRGGEVASSIAVQCLISQASGSEPLAEMKAGFAAANLAIQEHAASRPECEGMGTTVAALYLTPGLGYLAHIGDSRIYRLRQGELEILTRDHSLVAELVRQGSLSAEEARNHPRRSILTRALGTTEEPQVEYAEVDLADGDTFLLCTDGLTTEVTDTEIASILASGKSPRAKARQLVDLANRHGGSDNITAIVVAMEHHA